MNKIIEIKFGSALYGTSTPNSDIDLKSIYLPSARQILTGKFKKVDNISRPKKPCERNNKDDIDIEIFSLCRFLEDLMDGQTWALDVLFAPKSFWTESTAAGEQIMAEIFDNRDKLLSRNVNAFIGYARQQAARYGIKGSRMDSLKRVMAVLEDKPVHERLGTFKDEIYKLVEDSKELVSLEKTPLIEVVMVPGPNKHDLLEHLHICGKKMSFTTTIGQVKKCYGKILENYGERAYKAHLSGGKDWKALSHAVRVNGEGLELLETGFVTFPRPDWQLLTDIKTEKVDFDKVSELIEVGLVNLYEAQEKSTLRAEPDREWAEDFIYRTYSRIVKNS
jgi:RNA repair pathway DNA polymerase beta family protein